MSHAPSITDELTLEAYAEAALKREPLHVQSEGLEDLPHKLSFVAGGLAALYGLKKRGLLGLFSAGVATGLVYHGARQNGLLAGGWKRRLMHTNPQKMVPFSRQLIVDRPVEEVYRFFRNLENLAVYLPDLRDVKILDETHSRWELRLAESIHMEWTAKIVEEQPERLVVWKVCDVSDLYHEGWVSFEPLRDGASTRMSFRLYLLAPGGELGARFTQWVKQLPLRFFASDMQRLRNIIESGIHNEMGHLE